ncbi:S8 family peptidase [Lewinella sp. IMCC34191]|uniref:S8 family peptidase n=1 Tax=Lewinella sp. IMCC34191 TaxID=2259172 RepID=UPI0013007E41|nr:S8/S53 family peptidase [Lewinella sp. IMCC34191]
MTTHHLSYLFILCLGLFVSGCEPIEDPQPENCDYDTPTVTFSDPGECEPNLVWLRGLHKPVEGALPELPLDCYQKSEFGRVVEVPASTSSSRFILHVYNGTKGYVYAQVFGVKDCQSGFEPVTECVGDDRVGFKIYVDPSRSYDRYFVRIDLAKSAPNESYEMYEAEEGNFVALSAYAGKEPQFASEMSYNTQENVVDGQQTVPPPTLKVSCSGQTFQRLIFSSCSSKQDLAAWVKEIGLPVSESYEGESGSVVAADVPEGMSLQTVGGTSLEKRPTQDTTGMSVESDYIINLFNPEDPDDFFGSLERTDAPKLEEIRNCVAFRPQGKSTSDEDQVIVSIIDSGVDVSRVNSPYWIQTIYQQAMATTFVKPRRLGFDFIENDYEPNDVVPHGTFVAGAAIGGYGGAAPLTTVHFKIFGEENAATYFGALVALREAITIKSDVINMSWGFYSQTTPRALQCLVEEAKSRGIVLVTSAGNEGDPINRIHQWPASFAATYPQTVVSVASYDFENQKVDPDDVVLTSFSNYGEPDVAVAAFMTTETPNYDATGTGYFLGTSISTPIVTRAVANLTATGAPGVRNLQSVYGTASQLSSGAVTNGAYLPVCLKEGMP